MEFIHRHVSITKIIYHLFWRKIKHNRIQISITQHQKSRAIVLFLQATKSRKPANFIKKLKSILNRTFWDELYLIHICIQHKSSGPLIRAPVRERSTSKDFGIKLRPACFGKFVHISQMWARLDYDPKPASAG